jgi:dipeptidyl aminopeptidase/acylaminoacyl peptidase
MNDNVAFDRFVADQFARVGQPVPPADSVDDILVQARRMRPLPRWLATIKEPPMRISSRVAVGSPTFRLVTLATLTLALVLALGAAVVAGASLLPSPPQRVPAPYGPALNGAIVYAHDGDIYTVDADGGNPRAIVTGATMDDSPWYSHDGTRIAFIRHAYPAEIWVAHADGSQPTRLAQLEPSTDTAEWMPDDRQLVMDRQQAGSRSISIVDADGSGNIATLDLQGVTPDFWVVPRPRDGAELIFGGYSPVDGTGQVYAIRPDGTGLRQVGELPQANDVFMQPNVSPDGQTIAFWNAEPTRGEPVASGFGDASIHLRDLDTGADRVVQLDPASRAEKKPVWSPDGTSIAFLSLATGQVAIAPADGGGPAIPIGRVFSSTDDFEYGFSPDGTLLLEGLFGAGPSGGMTTVYDIATGGVTTSLDLDIPSWQRLAP